eukprot:COSAG02_NODE_54188_length_297_cov_1.045455_1_plen_78_part_10
MIFQRPTQSNRNIRHLHGVLKKQFNTRLQPKSFGFQNFSVFCIDLLYHLWRARFRQDVLRTDADGKSNVVLSILQILH